MSGNSSGDECQYVSKQDKASPLRQLVSQWGDMAMRSDGIRSQWASDLHHVIRETLFKEQVIQLTSDNVAQS